MKTVLVTGASGQLGKCIESIKDNHSSLQFIFADSKTLDITKLKEVKAFFDSRKINWCINCAAYTAVDKAESDAENANQVNVHGVKNLAQACANHNAKFIHISTDFVFDGNQSSPYSETDETNPLGVYGKTKRDGEQEVSVVSSKYFIIRTSWLYSEYNNNFMKTMLRLSQDRDEISVVADQTGTPTYAKDLAQAILEMVNQNSTTYGIYHYSNEGVASWYDFAKAIFELNGNTIKTLPINTSSYPTPAKRPPFSVLDKTKIKEVFHLNIPYWRDSLKECLSNMTKDNY